MNGIGNTGFHGSIVEDHIYDIMMDGHIMIAGTEDTYDEELFDAVQEFFTEKCASIQWNMMCSMWPNEEGGTVSCAWIEAGILHTLGWDFIKKGVEL